MYQYIITHRNRNQTGDGTHSISAEIHQRILFIYFNHFSGHCYTHDLYLLHLNTLFRTICRTEPTAHAFLRLKLPLLFRAVNIDRLLRTFLRTERAEHTLFQIRNRLATRGCCRFFFDRFMINCLFLLCARVLITGNDRQTLLRTHLGTITALHTVKAVNGPGSGRAVDCDRTGRTIAAAKTAHDALVDSDLHMSAAALRVDRRLCRLRRCHRLRKEVF